MRKKNQWSKTKLIPSANLNIFRKAWLLLLFLSVVSLSGCARKPFGIAFEGDEYSRLEQRFISHQNSFGPCPTSLDGKVIVDWNHSLNRTSFSGYFKTLLPSSLQFTAVTPLNQPLYALSSNGDWFQSIDISKRIFKKGSLRSFAIRHEIPIALLAGEWGAWLAGRPLSTAPYVLGIYADSDNRGIWFSVADGPDTTYPKEFTLINFDQQRIIERAIPDKQGKTEAVIKYEEWQTVGECLQPTKISVSGLAFGGEATMKFRDIQPANLSNSDFNLPIPRGYKRQFLP